MGGGSWTTKSINDYTTKTRGMTTMAFASMDSMSAQEVFKTKGLHPDLDPKNVMRECRDTEEHPETIPVILALDVTGSMGPAASKVARKLNDIMTGIYAKGDIKDVEFCFMAIGDVYYDKYPIQISQFESDVRIAEHVDKIYFEAGGGGNSFESYTAAWYMGVRHCDLDCWKRGKKGIIITLGDELPNPYLPKETYYYTYDSRFIQRPTTFTDITGDNIQDSIQTEDLIKETLEKFDIYHISVDDESSYHINNTRYNLDGAWTELLGDHYSVETLDSLPEKIVSIIVNSNQTNTSFIPINTVSTEPIVFDEEIIW